MGKRGINILIVRRGSWLVFGKIDEGLWGFSDEKV